MKTTTTLTSERIAHLVLEVKHNAVPTGVLEQFAKRPTLYSTPYFRDAREQQARLNLARSLERL